MAARKVGVTPGMDKEEGIDALKGDIREVEGELAETIHEIKSRVSYGALKGRAMAGVREIAVEKPRQIAGSAVRSGYGYLRQAEEKARQYPIVPLFAGILILTPLVIARIMRRKH